MDLRLALSHCKVLSHFKQVGCDTDFTPWWQSCHSVLRQSCSRLARMSTHDVPSSIPFQKCLLYIGCRSCETRLRFFFYWDKVFLKRTPHLILWSFSLIVPHSTSVFCESSCLRLCVRCWIILFVLCKLAWLDALNIERLTKCLQSNIISDIRAF